jgi:hypothetical protein
MKKTLLVLGMFFLMVCLFLLRNQEGAAPDTLISRQTAILPERHATQTSEAALHQQIVNHITNPAPLNQTEDAIQPSRVTRFDTLADVKAKITSLKMLETDVGGQVWISDGKPVIFELKNQRQALLAFPADFVELDVKATSGAVRSLHLHSQNMDLEEIRAFGQSLSLLLGLDSKPFLTWCDTAGNQPLDGPVFSSGAGTLSSPDKFTGFGVRHSFNERKPWFVRYTSEDK